MIDPLSTWQSTFASIPKVSDNSWASNVATWYSDRITNIEPNQTELNTAAGFSFTFSEAVFQAQLALLPPTTNQATGIAGFASAWSSAIALTIYPATLSVAPGAYLGVSSPPTLFSSITSVIIDPTSITAAVAKINELASAPPANDPSMSEFPEKFRDATLLLTITVTGLNSITPTPTPLIAPLIPLT